MHFDCVRQSCDGSAARRLPIARNDLLGRLAVARLPAITLLVIVHGAVLTALLAIGRLVRRKRDGGASKKPNLWLGTAARSIQHELQINLVLST
jgi:hypothetical protein